MNSLDSYLALGLNATNDKGSLGHLSSVWGAGTMNHDSACGTGSVEGMGTEAIKGLTSEIAMNRNPKVAPSNGNTGGRTFPVVEVMWPRY
jgi:hypothetical protein